MHNTVVAFLADDVTRDFARFVIYQSRRSFCSRQPGQLEHKVKTSRKIYEEVRKERRKRKQEGREKEIVSSLFGIRNQEWVAAFEVDDNELLTILT